MTGISTQTFHALGWALLHFVWQGAVLAGFLAASLTVCRSTNVRYALSVATLMLMVAVPVVTFSSFTQVQSPPIQSPLQVATSVQQAVASGREGESSRALVRALSEGANRQGTMRWVVQAWFIGVMLFCMRAAGGLWWLARTRRLGVAPLPEDTYRQCLELQRHMGLTHRIRYGQCQWLDAPVVLGWFRPLVLVTTRALIGLSPQQLQAIIAHELAHIRRCDAWVNLFQITVEVLLFYHPAVWWVNRKIRLEREVCCDQEALAACGEPVGYARALTLMEEWRMTPWVSMAANRGPLAQRVLRLLDLQSRSTGSRAIGVGASALGVAIALFVGYVFMAATWAAADAGAVEEIHPIAPPDIAVPFVPAIVPTSLQALSPLRPLTQPASPVAPAVSSMDEPAASKRSYIESLAAVGLNDLSADELIALKVHGVTSQYIEEIHRCIDDANIEQIIAMQVHGITPSYVRELQSAGFGTRNAEDFVRAKIQGITAELIENVSDRGRRKLTLEQILRFRHLEEI